MSNKDIKGLIAAGKIKLERIAFEQMEHAAILFARKAVKQAVTYYNRSSADSNLTGNTAAGFSAGVFINGTCRYLVNALQVTKVKAPTHGYTYPGDSGFQDVDSGEYIGSDDDPSVKKYSPDRGIKWKRVIYGGDSISDADAWLMSYHAPKKSIMVVVVNPVPYADFLKYKRDYDIFDETSRPEFVSKSYEAIFKNVKLKEGGDSIF